MYIKLPQDNMPRVINTNSKIEWVVSVITSKTTFNNDQPRSGKEKDPLSRPLMSLGSYVSLIQQGSAHVSKIS